MIPLSWSGRSAGTGVLRTRCIGCWTSPSARMTAACATGRLRATLLSFARSLSTWSPETGAPKPAYAARAKKPPGTTATCSRSSHAKIMREPWSDPDSRVQGHPIEGIRRRAPETCGRGGGDLSDQRGDVITLRQAAPDERNAQRHKGRAVRLRRRVVRGRRAVGRDRAERQDRGRAVENASCGVRDSLIGPNKILDTDFRIQLDPDANAGCRALRRKRASQLRRL